MPEFVNKKNVKYAVMAVIVGSIAVYLIKKANRAGNQAAPIQELDNAGVLGL